jgi:hypothetical protein
MASSPPVHITDPNLVKPGDIVWLDAKHLTSTRKDGGHTWPHFAVCLFYYDPTTGTVPNAIVSGTVFQFACISSITRNNPLDTTKQIRLDHADPNLGLKGPSAACVDFAAEVKVSVNGQRDVLDGVRRLTDPVVRRVPASPTLQAIIVLFEKYWKEVAATAQAQPPQGVKQANALILIALPCVNGVLSGYRFKNTRFPIARCVATY